MEIGFRSYATTYGTGPFHPAIRDGRDVWYWPNRTFMLEDDAYEAASLAIKDAWDAAQAVAKEWNVIKA
jgi:hypothetical protein